MHLYVCSMCLCLMHAHDDVCMHLVCVCICVSMYVCVCACACLRTYIYVCVCVFESSVLHHHNVTKFSFHFIVLDGAPGTVGTAAPTAAKGLAAAEAAAKRAITARGETIGVLFFFFVCVCVKPIIVSH